MVIGAVDHEADFQLNRSAREDAHAARNVVPLLAERFENAGERLLSNRPIDDDPDSAARAVLDDQDDRALEARVTYTAVSRLKLCQIEVSQHRIAHTVSRGRSSEHPYVKIHFQTEGTSYFEQEGRRIELKPGDCLAYDVSCPHTIVSPALTRHEVVIVPKELLKERGFRLDKM